MTMFAAPLMKQSWRTAWPGLAARIRTGCWNMPLTRERSDQVPSRRTISPPPAGPIFCRAASSEVSGA